MILGTLKEKVLSVLSHYQTSSVLETLERAGLTIEGFKLILSDKNYAANIVRYANNQLLDSNELDNQLLSLLGDSSFFGPSDWLRYYRSKIENFELPISITSLENILNEGCPFSPGRKVKDTHYLFCLPDDYNEAPLTINQWEIIYKHESKITLRGVDVDGHPCNYSDSFYSSLDFSKNETANFNWYLMFKGVVRGSTNKNLSEQKEMLKKRGYEIPKAVEVLPLLLLFYEKNKDLINEGRQIHGRTADEFLTNNTIAIDTECLNGQKIFIYNGIGNFFIKNNVTLKSPLLGVYAFRKL